MAANPTGATTIMIIRHAEKPGTYNGVAYDGVDSSGDTCGSSAGEHLITIGWERAGGLVTLFAPSWGPKPGLATPDFLYASDPESKHKPDAAASSAQASKDSGPSQRPYETLTALAAMLGSSGTSMSINTNFKKSDYSSMVADALNCTGTVLICWQHEDIPLQNANSKAGISQCILTQTETQGTLNVPTTWPVDANNHARYDLIFVFNRPSGTGAIQSFQMIAQHLLAGDEAAPSLSQSAGL